MLPPQVAVVPLYVMWAKLGNAIGFQFVGSLWPLIIPAWLGDAFSIFLLRQFFLTIPEEYLDAARVDGCGEFRILTTVVLRLAKPAIAAVALFSVLYTLQRLLPAAALHGRELVELAGLGRALAVPQPAPGAVEPDDGGDARRDGAGDHPLLPRPARLRRGRDADGGEGMKLAVVGAGSTYTPELVAGLAGLEVDAARAARRRPGAAGGRRRPGRADARARAASRASCRSAASWSAAVEGADFVLVQIRVGGQAARLHDETAPLPCGCIGQETTGAGGFAKAMRTVPVVLEIADRVRELAGPDAWIVDFTNPVGIVTPRAARRGAPRGRALQRRDHAPAAFAALLGVEPARVVVDQVGLNHLTWVRGVLLDGERRAAGACSRSTGTSWPTRCELPRRLLEELGAVPSYYLRYFYEHDAVLAEQLEGVPRAETVAEIERGLLELYRDPSLNEKPALLEQRGGAFYSEAAAGLVRSLAYDIGDVHEVDVRNDGTLAGLPTTTSSRCPRASSPGGSCRSTQRAARARSCSASSSTSPPTSG